MRADPLENPIAPKRILLYYDGTRSGRRALERAARLACDHNSELYVLTVALERVTPEDLDSKAVSDLSRLTRQAALREARSSLAGREISAHFELREGYRANEIVDAALRHSADLIVMPEHRSFPLLGRFFPSFSDRVGRLTEIPLLTVG